MKQKATKKRTTTRTATGATKKTRKSSARSKSKKIDVNKTGPAQDKNEIVAAQTVKEAEPRSTEATIVLDTSVCISNIIETRDLLLVYQDGYKKISLDISHVEMIDTSGLQLLTSFINYLRQNSVEIAWIGESKVIRETAGLLGLTRHLKL